MLVDPLWGSGAGWLSRLLAGGRIRIHEIHQERNPYFGGVNPEPIRPNIDEALGMLAGGGVRPRAASSTATRTGRARPTSAGRSSTSSRSPGLLMYYLAEHRGWRDPVVVSVNNTSMAARLGERYGIETHETPVGFKFIGPKMIETGAMMGAEESGGFGFGMHLPERDGIYADLLLLDLFMRETSGRPLAGVGGHASTSTRSPGRRSTAASTSTWTGPSTPRSSDGCSSIWPPTRRRSWPASRSTTRSRWTPATASSSSSPTARGC